MSAIARFLYITIDAQDAERIADLWAAVLDTEREEELDEGRFLVLKGRDDLPALCVQRVPEPKQGKVRIGSSDPGRHRLADVRRPGGSRVRHPPYQILVGRSSTSDPLERSWNSRMNAASLSTPSRGIAL